MTLSMKLDSCCDRRIFVLIKHKLFEVYKEDIVCADSGLGDKELLAMENEPIRTKGRRQLEYTRILARIACVHLTDVE